jgi:hypothetical protein
MRSRFLLAVLALLLAAPIAAADNRVMVYCDPQLDCGASAKNEGSCNAIFPIGTTSPCASFGGGTFAIGVIVGSPQDTCVNNDDCYNVVANLCYKGRILGVEMPNGVGGDVNVPGERPALRDVELSECMPQG